MADPKTNTPKESRFDRWVKKMQAHEHRSIYVFHRILYIFERIIAGITLAAIIFSLGHELYHIFSENGLHVELNTFLHHILTVVVGLEFVRMLIDTTPASVLEVLTVAITRHVILSQGSPFESMASIACIAGLFAVRHFLIRKDELNEEMVELE